MFLWHRLAARRESGARADTYVVCYTLNRKAFHDILGPIEDIWRYEALRKVRQTAMLHPPRPALRPRRR